MSDQRHYLDIGTGIIDRTIRWLTPVFFFLPVVLIIRALRAGGLYISIIQSVSLTLIWVISFTKNQTTPKFRLSIYIFILIFVGLIGMLRWGVMGTGYVPIILAIILSTMLGKRNWLIIFGIAMASVASMAIYWITGVGPIPFEPAMMMRLPVVWIIMFFSTLITAAASFIWEGIYQRMVSSMVKVHEHDRKYREIINAASDALIIHDTEGTILDVNEAACSLFGFDPDTAEGYSFERLSLGESPYSLAEALHKIELAITHGPQMFEWHCRRVSGELFWAEVALTASIIDGKQSIISSIRDLSKRKHAEDEQRKLEAQLHQSQKMEAVGRLAGGVAHDYNNMLGVILGHTDMAIEDIQKGKSIGDSLHEIRSAAERSANLTRQLLMFARKQAVMPQVIELNKAVGGMLRILTRLIGENILLRWIPAEDLWRIKIDPTQVDQILTNLCINARDAIKHVGKLTIETQNITIDDSTIFNHSGFIPGDYVLLAVSDDGCGMDQHTMENLFEPFFTTKGMAHGSGLGLATLYGIVKQNKGYVYVYSELNIGTTFKLYFPKNTDPPSYIKEKAAQPAGKGHETILLVEDEPSILKMTAMMLEQNGYKVLCAPKPSQAIRMASVYDEDIHLLITDVIMPEMNGQDLLKHISGYFQDIKSIYISGYTANIIAHHGVLAKGVNFIQKPFSKHILLSKVREVLDTSPDASFPIPDALKNNTPPQHPSDPHA